jgi:hypothetical protein
MVDYWLPAWWGWIENWDQCSTCLAYNGSPCASCEIPPGMLGLVQLVGGGTAAVAGNLRGNATIASQQQAQAAGRVPGVSRQQVNIQVEQQNAQLNRIQEQQRNRNGMQR